MRVSISGDTACRRWLVEKPRKGIAGMYFMLDEFKMQSEHLKGYNEKQEGVETRDTHPLKEMDKNFQVTPKDSHKKASLPEGPAEIGVKPEKTSDPNLKEKTPFSRGVSLSHLPQLNGSSDGAWKDHQTKPR